MKNQQLKQKAIQEAYQRIGLWEDLPEHVKEYAFANNGFIKSKDLKDERHKKVFECNIGVKWSGEPDCEYRSNDLTGIGTNNGWTRIELDGSNLPAQTEQRFQVIEFRAGEMIILTNDCSYMGVNNKFEFDCATHYRPVTELPKPIY